MTGELMLPFILLIYQSLNALGNTVGAGIAFGLAALGAGIAIGGAGAAATAAVAEHPERPEVRTFSLIMVALGEAVAIYGIVIAILILSHT
ncbi:MAG: ATPase [Nitrososphaeria archaeon]|jgi:V/A-type H+-transporting ATPase subunit K